MKNLQNLKGVKALSKTQQKAINGGASCPTYPASECINCGGFPVPNGCCLGTHETHCCLNNLACE